MKKKKKKNGNRAREHYFFSRDISRDYSSMRPFIGAISSKYYSRTRIVATSYPFAIELFSVGRMHYAFPGPEARLAKIRISKLKYFPFYRKTDKNMYCPTMCDDDDGEGTAAFRITYTYAYCINRVHGYRSQLQLH